MQTTQNSPRKVEIVDYGEFGQTEVFTTGINFRQKFQMDCAGTRRPSAILCKACLPGWPLAGVWEVKF